MTPWFLATQPFLPAAGETWQRSIDWSGLTQLRELVSLDGMLCPPVLRDIKDEYWPYIVNESFMLNYFVDFDFLMAQLTNIRNKNVLCVFRNPTHQPEAPSFARFAFLGYDLTDREGSHERPHKLWRLSGHLRQRGTFPGRPIERSRPRHRSAA
jgi:hypothetical protein